MHFSRQSTAELLARGGFFWLDLDKPDADDFEILREVFGFHPLAVEDSEHFDQRAKIEDYDDFVFLVVYGASPDDDRLVEVHCFYSERFLVTVHRDDCPAFAEIRSNEILGGSTAPIVREARFLQKNLLFLQTLRVTPAMEAGIADHVWSLEEIVGLLG